MTGWWQYYFHGTVNPSCLDDALMSMCRVGSLLSVRSVNNWGGFESDSMRWCHLLIQSHPCLAVSVCHYLCEWHHLSQKSRGILFLFGRGGLQKFVLTFVRFVSFGRRSLCVCFSFGLLSVRNSIGNWKKNIDKNKCHAMVDYFDNQGPMSLSLMLDVQGFKFGSGKLRCWETKWCPTI